MSEATETVEKAVKPKRAAAAPAVGKPIMLPQLDVRNIKITLVGQSALITHAWSEKAKKEMLDKQMGVATAGKEPKDPERDFWESLYPIDAADHAARLKARNFTPVPDGYGFPAVAFKNAAVTACTSLGKAITKVAARQAFHVGTYLDGKVVNGDLVRIRGTPTIREDMVRIGMGTADIRFRGEFKQWSCEVVVRYNARVLSDEQILNLFNVAGFAVGVGEWRPEKDGQYGLFHVA